MTVAWAMNEDSMGNGLHLYAVHHVVKYPTTRKTQKNCPVSIRHWTNPWRALLRQNPLMDPSEPGTLRSALFQDTLARGPRSALDSGRYYVLIDCLHHHPYSYRDTVAIYRTNNCLNNFSWFFYWYISRSPPVQKSYLQGKYFERTAQKRTPTIR